MEYLKIAEIANKCEVKRSQISEYYRIIGANSQFPNDIKNALYKAIKDMERELKLLELKIVKYIKSKNC